jgi:hypothetical protein
MRNHRLPVLLALCATPLIAVASTARADPSGPHEPASTNIRGHRTAHHRAETPLGSTSVGVRVLPVTSSPAPTPRRPHHGEPPSSGSHGEPPSSGSHGGIPPGNESSTAVSADVDSDEIDDHTQHTGSGRHGHHHSPNFAGHHGGGYGHGAPPEIGPTPRHGKLPFTGDSLSITLLSAMATVLTGALLIWLTSARKKRQSRRNSRSGIPA